MDISGSITVISEAMTIAKQIKDIDSGFNKAEFKLQISELMSNLAEVKIDLSNAKILLDEKDKKIKDLQQKLKDRSNKTIKHNGHIYELDDEGKPLKNPYCQVCHQNQTNIILQDKGWGMACPKCKGEFSDLRHPNFPTPDRGPFFI